MKKIKKDKIALFASQISNLLKAGITFIQALDILILSENDKNFIKIIKKIQYNLNRGKNIYDSFKEFENIFSSHFMYMLKIGEISGTLSHSFDSISIYFNHSLENKRKILSLLIYPIIVFCLTIIILIFLLIFILPNFLSIFEENQIELPNSTKILLFISNNLFQILLSLLIIGILFFFYNRYINSQYTLKLKKDNFLLKLYILGKMFRLSFAIEIYYSLSIFLNTGISLVDGLEIIEENIKNLQLKKSLSKVKKEIKLGKPVTYSLKFLNLFNHRFQSYIQAGEESGFLAETFLEISKILKNEYEYLEKKYIAFIEPISIIFLAAIISYVLLAIYSPIFSINTMF